MSAPTDIPSSYADLLARLRRDLQLDATTDILPATILQALMPGTTLSFLKDTAGKSPFLQLPVAKVSLTWGVFTTATGVINSAGSGDWTLGTLAAGVATITFPTRAANPVVLLTPVNNASNIFAQATSVTTSTAAVQTATVAAPPVLATSVVSFIVIG